MPSSIKIWKIFSSDITGQIWTKLCLNNQAKLDPDGPSDVSCLNNRAKFGFDWPSDVSCLNNQAKFGFDWPCDVSCLNNQAKFGFDWFSDVSCLNMLFRQSLVPMGPVMSKIFVYTFLYFMECICFTSHYHSARVPISVD